MELYSKVLFDTIHNRNGYSFYKLLIEDKSHYDDFVKSLKRLPNEQSSLKKILALMEMFSPAFMQLPNKFRQIKNVKRSDVYEFKKNIVRVYVVLNKPDIYIVTGSLKKDQNKTIEKISKLLKNFNIKEV